MVRMINSPKKFKILEIFYVLENHPNFKSSKSISRTKPTFRKIVFSKNRVKNSSEKIFEKITKN
jgi:hypothetical protein